MDPAASPKRSGGAHRKPSEGVRSAVSGRLHRAVVVSRDRVLRRFWVSQMVSEMGDWIGLLGIAALLYEKTDMALAASASVAALYLPYLFAPLLVGWTAKIPPRTLLIGADLLRAALILLASGARPSGMVTAGSGLPRIGTYVGLRGDAGGRRS